MELISIEISEPNATWISILIAACYTLGQSTLKLLAMKLIGRSFTLHYIHKRILKMVIIIEAKIALSFVALLNITEIIIVQVQVRQEETCTQVLTCYLLLFLFCHWGNWFSYMVLKYTLRSPTGPKPIKLIDSYNLSVWLMTIFTCLWYMSDEEPNMKYIYEQ